MRARERERWGGGRKRDRETDRDTGRWEGGRRTFLGLSESLLKANEAVLDAVPVFLHLLQLDGEAAHLDHSVVLQHGTRHTDMCDKLVKYTEKRVRLASSLRRASRPDHFKTIEATT